MTKEWRMYLRIRNVCGWGMIGLEVVFAVSRICGLVGWTTMIFEILLLSLFGISWLVKGEAFGFLNDPVEE